MKAAKDGHHASRSKGEGLTGDQTFDRVLVSIGRRPELDVPGLDKTARRVDKRGFIVVDESRADRRAGDLRDRRRRRRADARAQGVARRARRGGRDCRRPQRRVRAGARSRRSSSPIPRSPGPGLTETEAEKQGHQGRRREVPVGRLGPRDLARPHRRRHQADHRSRRASACSASASAVPAPAS